MKLEELFELLTEDKSKGKKDACYTKVKSRYNVWPSAYASGALVKCRKVGAANWGNAKKESFMRNMIDVIGEEGLYQWFAHNKGKFKGQKSGGWVDCKRSKKGKLVPCGRKDTDNSGPYPACRPTYSQCNQKGERAKKSSKRVSWKK